MASSSRSRSRQPAFVAEPGDRDALDQLHHEVGTARVGGAGVEDLGDVGVVHQGQRLAFGPEPGEDLAAVHAGLDELERDRPPHRLGLLGHVDRAHAPLADRLEQLVRADDRAGAFAGRSAPTATFGRRGGIDGRRFEEAACRDDHGASRSSIPARSVSSPPHAASRKAARSRGVGQLGGGVEQALFVRSR